MKIPLLFIVVTIFLSFFVASVNAYVWFHASDCSVSAGPPGVGWSCTPDGHTLPACPSPNYLIWYVYTLPDLGSCAGCSGEGITHKACAWDTLGLTKLNPGPYDCNSWGTGCAVNAAYKQRSVNFFDPGMTVWSRGFSYPASCQTSGGEVIEVGYCGSQKNEFCLLTPGRTMADPEWRCWGDIEQRCVANFYTDIQTCVGGCEGATGRCNVCTEEWLDNYQCSGDWVQREWQNSDCSTEWRDYEDCSPGTCSGGSCSTCQEGWLPGVSNLQCSGSNLQRKWQNSDCSEEWRTYVTCPLGCADKRCNYYTVFEDDFTRTILGNWGKMQMGCTNNVEIENNKLHLENECPCPSLATYSLEYRNHLVVDDFYLEFDWHYTLNEVDGYGNPVDVVLVSWWKGTDMQTLMFDPWNEQINLLDDMFPFEESAWEEAYSYDPPDFSGWHVVTSISNWHPSWTMDTWHNFKIQRIQDILYITIDDGAYTFIDSGSQYNTARFGDFGLGLGNPGEESYDNNVAQCYYDNVLVGSSAQAKTTPQITVSLSPGNNISFGTQLTVTCSVDQPVSVTLQADHVNVANPYIHTYNSSEEGYHFFFCWSNETDDYAYAEGSNWVQVSAYGAGGYLPPVGPPSFHNVSWFYPIVNETEFQQANASWMLPFLTPFFFALIIMFFVTGLIAFFSKSPAIGLVTFICFIVAYAFMGIFPVWVIIILGIIAAILTGVTVRQMVGGT